MSAHLSARDPWFDNAKMALVTLVVVGHAWALLPGGGFVGVAYDFLYLWHMPAFVLVTGYLSRKFELTSARLWSLARTVAFPYVLFECALALFRVWVGGEELENLFADPHWPLWFLMALIFWRLLTPFFLAMSAPLAIAVAVAVSLGSGTLSGDASDVFDVSRVAGLLPFFVVGLHATPDALERLRAPGLRWVAAATLASMWLLAAGIDLLASTEWLYYRTPYADLGSSALDGMAVRAFLLVVALAGALAFLSMVPRVHGWFARMGAMTLVVYLVHGFVILSLEYAGYPAWAEASPVLAPVATLVWAVALSLLLASPPVARRLLTVVDPFGRAEQQVKEAVELTAVAQDTGSLPDMQTQVLTR